MENQWCNFKMHGGATREHQRNKSIDGPMRPVIIDRLFPWLHLSLWLCIMIIFR